MRKWFAVIPVLILMAALLVPSLALAKDKDEDDHSDEWDKSSLVGTCYSIDENGGLHATVTNTGSDMNGTTPWKLYWKASGNPKDGEKVFEGTVPALKAGESADLVYDTALNTKGTAINYGFKVYQRTGHPGKGVLWVTEKCGPTPPVPELPTTALLGLGLAAVAGIVLFRRHQLNNASA